MLYKYYKLYSSYEFKVKIIIIRWYKKRIEYKYKVILIDSSIEYNDSSKNNKV